MKIKDAINSAIAALKRIHVLGDEADKMAKIIKLLQSIVDAFEEVEREEAKHADCNE